MDAVERALEVLGLDHDATPEDVKQAYRDLTKVWHPDRFPNDSRLRGKAEEKLKDINEAYRTLQGYAPRLQPRTGAGPAAPAGPQPRGDHGSAQGTIQTKTSAQADPSQQHDAARPAARHGIEITRWAYLWVAILAVWLIYILTSR